jgi:DNA polymerase-3 subunit beta
MKITVLQENFAKALSIVSKAVSNKPSIPVLSNVLLSAHKDSVKLSGTDLEMGVNITIPAEVESDGAVTINAKLTSEYVLSLPAGRLVIELTDNVLYISNDQSSSKFSTISAEDFPLIPTATKDPTIEIEGTVFLDAISKVVIAAALDDNRPILTGILFESIDKDLVMVGVDGFRLSKKIMTFPKKLPEFKHVIPAKALTELLHVIDATDSKEKVKIFILSDKNQVVFSYRDIEVSSRILEGEFPDYRSILPTSHTISFSMNKDQLNAKIKIVSVFAKNVIGNKTVFELKSDESMLYLSSSAPELGENSSKLEVTECVGGDLKTAYNARYLQSMLTVMMSDEILFETNGPTLPAVFKDPKDKDFLHIVMPMKLD